MNDLLGREVVRARDLGGTGGASVQGPALLEQSPAGCAVDGAVDAASSEKTLICGIDNRIDGESGDVASNNGDFLVVRRIVGGDGLWGGMDLADLVEELNGGDVGDGGGDHFDCLSNWHRRASWLLIWVWSR